MATAELSARAHHDETPGPAHDPVCGMSVDPATARHHAQHDGHDHPFSSARRRGTRP